jgi:putative transposase
MPRQARLDSPGTLHHVMARGIEGNEIFRVKRDREDFLGRLATVCEQRGLICYAWTLMSNTSTSWSGAASTPLLRA